MANDIYDLRTRVTKALANPLRLKIIDQLDQDQKKCVCELVDALGCDQPVVSKHLAVLKNAGLVTMFITSSAHPVSRNFLTASIMC